MVKVNNVICNVDVGIYHKNKVFLIVQGVAKDVPPSQGHVYGSFKGIVTYVMKSHPSNDLRPPPSFVYAM